MNKFSEPLPLFIYTTQACSLTVEWFPLLFEVVKVHNALETIGKTASKDLPFSILSINFDWELTASGDGVAATKTSSKSSVTLLVYILISTLSNSTFRQLDPIS